MSDSPVLTPRAGVERLAPYIPGDADVSTTIRARLASNENPLGPSPAAIRACCDRASDVHVYPDGSASELRHRLASWLGVAADRLVCGAGSDELISLLTNAYLTPGETGVVTAHGFLMYRLAIQAADGVVQTAAEPGRKLDIDDILAHSGPGTRLVFVASPNNPTGDYLTGAELARLRAGLPAETLLVVDTAYAEYADAHDYDRGLALAAESPNTVILGTFSKIHGLAGLRLGWAYAPGAVCDVLNRLRSPFNISSLAQAAGIAALDDSDHLAASQGHNARWRAWTIDRLQRLGCSVEPSQGNYVLAAPPRDGRHDAASLRAALLERGVLVRPMEKYGLPDWLRISIGTGEALEKLIAELEDLIAHDRD